MQIKVRGVLPVSVKQASIKKQVVTFPIPRTQYKKMPAYRTVTATDPEGNIIVTRETIMDGDHIVTLEELLQPALDQKKAIEDSLKPGKKTEETAKAVEAANELTQLVEHLGLDEVTDETDLTHLTIQEGRVGLGCPTCGRFYEFKPSEDLESWVCVDPLIPVINKRFVCEGCEHIIELDYRETKQ